METQQCVMFTCEVYKAKREWSDGKITCELMCRRRDRGGNSWRKEANYAKKGSKTTTVSFVITANQPHS